ncbi:DUF4190 domain-containing protein [Subtercola boreus]|uniref:DUF4190 domain-containing protein n=1 Tax=Subtercola boreus TaxID=120213 RepID=A0A3E0WEU0_9MICO|nr:DUF4190 domain-containing protein [Subtercola boreus]RFA22502.1 hypothetical protein B7R24_02420 [Subtercola boreus]RFA23272.1 hypothetical protein B7R23_02410 [Subtercola boreus]RFA29080.1 hypothetical protein B7R25_02425 [Subtercola boreus]
MTDNNVPPLEPPPYSGGGQNPPYTPPPVPPAYGQGAPPYSGGGQNPPYTVQKPGETWNILAIVSIVSAFFVSLVAIITGHIALSQIKRSGEKGRGLALAGTIIGYAGVFFSLVVGIILLVVFVSGANRAIENFPTVAPTNGGSNVSGDLDWDAGQSLSPSDRPEFIDVFATDPAWVVSSADDGNGNWSYDSADKLCTLTFQQGVLPTSVVVTPGDDRATTSSYLQDIDSATGADIEEYALDDFLSYGSAGAASVDVLTLSGTDTSNNNWITAARAFSQTGTGLYLDLTCNQSATLDDYYYSVIDKAVVRVP